MEQTILLIAIIVLLVGIMGFLLWRERSKKENGDLDNFASQASKLFEVGIKDFMDIASLSFKEREERVQNVFEQIRKELQGHKAYVDTLEKERAKTFIELQKDLQASTALTDRLRISTEKLHSILSNSRLRGQFGEQIAEDILRAGGLLEGIHYVKNKQLETTTTRPDFTFLLPDKHKINVDVKFPLENFSRMIESDDWETAQQGEVERYKRAFLQDIKQKLKEVSSREYINPNENTLDFVILFIPNERLASYIHETFPEIFQLAVQNHVVLSSPYNLISFVSMIQRSFQNFYQRENIRDILLLISEFGERYKLFKKRFGDIGERIEKAQTAYEDVSEKSFKMLDSTIGKIEKAQSGSSLPDNSSERIGPEENKDG